MANSSSSVEASAENKAEPIKAVDSPLVVHADYTSGPLPRASEFKKYEEVLPGAANRIVKMAEKSLDAEVRDNEQYRKIVFVSMIINKIIVVALIIVAFILLLMGKSIEAFFAGIVPIIQIISTIDFKSSKSKGE